MITFVLSTFAIYHLLNFIIGMRSSRPMSNSGGMNSASAPIDVQKSLLYMPAMAARMAVTECVTGRNGLMSEMMRGMTASGYAPFEPEICMMRNSTPMALPTLPKLATIVYAKNE